MERLGSGFCRHVMRRVLAWAERRLAPGAGRGTVAELYAGVGAGAAVAAEVWGSAATFFAEPDPLCQQLLAARWPEAVMLDDAEGAQAQRRFPARVGLLLVGFPCAPHSALVQVDAAAVRASVEGLKQALRMLRRGAAEVVVLENVAGILRAGYDLVNSLLLEFDKYVWHVGVVNSCLHGATPMARERVIWVGVLKKVFVEPGEPAASPAAPSAPPPQPAS